MLFNMPYMKDIIIKNMTGEELKDLCLIYEGLEKNPYKISEISKNGQRVINLVLLYLTKPTDLTLTYNKNGDKKEIVVYDNLWKNDLRTLVLTISKNGDKLQVETIIDEKRV